VLIAFSNSMVDVAMQLWVGCGFMN